MKPNKLERPHFKAIPELSIVNQQVAISESKRIETQKIKPPPNSEKWVWRWQLIQSLKLVLMFLNWNLKPMNSRFEEHLEKYGEQNLNKR